MSRCYGKLGKRKEPRSTPGRVGCWGSLAGSPTTDASPGCCSPAKSDIDALGTLPLTDVLTLNPICLCETTITLELCKTGIKMFVVGNQPP